MADATPRHTPLVLIIRDGWGENPNPEHDRFNAIKLARTPVADRLMREYPTTLIKTSGEDVGLPRGVMGNSEVGHQNIGAGRIVDQEIMRITRTIRDGSFFENKALLGAFEHAKVSGGAVHLLGLVSDGQVHSDIEHLFALIDLAAKLKFPGDRLLVHAITDGRDVGPTTAVKYLQQLEDKLASSRIGRIATVMGRYYAMDRDNRWDRVQWAYQALTGRIVHRADVGNGITAESSSYVSNTSALEAVQEYYAYPTDPSRVGDEFIEPRVIMPDPPPVRDPRWISGGDAVIFFNYRGDRPREITKAFVLDDAAWKKLCQTSGGFDRGQRIENLYFCTMTGYEQGLPVTAIAFDKPPKLPNILGEYISSLGLKQLRCAETEKFPHVTFFFNDYREEPFPGEQRELIPSPKDVTTYDQKPEMSAQGVCDAIIAAVARLSESGESRASPIPAKLRSTLPTRSVGLPAIIIVNFANGDMVGHTGKLEAAIKAIEVVDACVGRIVDATLNRGGSLIITADHGNAEQMWDPVNNCPHTAHTTYDVPLIVVGEPFKSAKLRAGGRLADIAPTALRMMGLEQPREMMGESLLSGATT